MKTFADRLNPHDFIKVKVSKSDLTVTVRNSDNQFNTYLELDDAREFALEILRLCGGDAQVIDRLTAPKEDPKETKAIVVRRDAGGTLEYIDTAESVTEATGKAERFASYNNSASFIVFTPVAEAKATVTVDLNHSPTL